MQSRVVRVACIDGEYWELSRNVRAPILTFQCVCVIVLFFFFSRWLMLNSSNYLHWKTVYKGDWCVHGNYKINGDCHGNLHLSCSIHSYCQPLWSLEFAQRNSFLKVKWLTLKQNIVQIQLWNEVQITPAYMAHFISVLLVKPSNNYLEMQLWLRKNWNSSTCKYITSRHIQRHACMHGTYKQYCNETSEA